MALAHAAARAQPPNGELDGVGGLEHDEVGHPALVDAATTTVTLTPASGKVINRDAKWTYTYANTSVAAPGTYGGVNTNNSRVTYTASMP